MTYNTVHIDMLFPLGESESEESLPYVENVECFVDLAGLNGWWRKQS